MGGRKAGSTEEELTKVRFDLPHHWATGGESMWARDLGGDLYELRNVPFHAYGVSHLDVVRAVAPDAGLKPRVLALVRPSGRSTLRIFFQRATSRERQDAILAQIAALGAELERATGTLCALDLPPEVPVAQVRARLDVFEEAGELEYETCEARTIGSFDDAALEPGTEPT